MTGLETVAPCSQSRFTIELCHIPTLLVPAVSLGPAAREKKKTRINTDKNLRETRVRDKLVCTRYMQEKVLITSVVVRQKRDLFIEGHEIKLNSEEDEKTKKMEMNKLVEGLFLLSLGIFGTCW